MEDKEKIELIEDLAAHHMEASNLPPLASKMFAFLLVNWENEGYTFDELVEALSVSKSSVSTNLNLLIQFDFIEQFNKIGERKRRYRITTHYLVIRLRKIRNQLMKEKLLSERLLNFHFSRNKERKTSGVEKSNIYIKHLATSVENLNTTIEKINKITNTI